MNDVALPDVYEKTIFIISTILQIEFEISEYNSVIEENKIKEELLLHEALRKIDDGKTMIKILEKEIEKLGIATSEAAALRATVKRRKFSMLPPVSRYMALPTNPDAIGILPDEIPDIP